MSLITALYIVITAMVFAAVLALVAVWRARHRTVICPETGKMVHVAVDEDEAVKAVFTGEHLKVVNCSRWPERADCDRDCEEHLHA
jgi:hypothetical protein